MANFDAVTFLKHLHERTDKNSVMCLHCVESTIDGKFYSLDFTTQATTNEDLNAAMVGMFNEKPLNHAPDSYWKQVMDFPMKRRYTISVNKNTPIRLGVVLLKGPFEPWAG